MQLGQDMQFQRCIEVTTVWRPCCRAAFLVCAILLSFGASARASNVERAGHFIYNADGEIYQYRVMPDGHWKPLTPASVSLPDAVATDSVVVTDNGKFVYAEATYNAFVALYRVTANGILQPLNPAAAQADSHPSGIVTDPAGRFLYVSCSYGDICEYRIGQNGELAQIGGLAFDGTARDPTEVEFSPRGRRAITIIDDIAFSGADVYEAINLRIAPDGELRIISRHRVSAYPKWVTWQAPGPQHLVNSPYSG
jgi:hypothetical protein